MTAELYLWIIAICAVLSAIALLIIAVGLFVVNRAMIDLFRIVSKNSSYSDYR